MDVDTVLLSVQERDKWTRRLELLQQTLREIRERRARLNARLRRIKGELRKLADYSDAILGHSPRALQGRTTHAQPDTYISTR